MRFCYAHRRFALYPQNLDYKELIPEDYTPLFLKMVKDMGFDAIEMDVGVLEKAGDSEHSIREFAKRIADYGLAIGAVRAGGSLTDARHGAANRERTLRAIELAGWAGVEVVNGALSARARIPGCPPGSVTKSGSGWPESQDASREAMLWVFDSLKNFYKQAARKGENHGVNVAVEVHQNSPIDNSWSALMLYQMVDEPNFGINPDIGNVMWNYDVPEENFDDSIKALAPISVYWHCKNFMRVYHPENNRAVFLRVPLPDGEIDYRFAVAAMLKADYEGYMAIEGAWAGDQWESDTRSLNYAKRLWDEAG